MSNLWVNTKIQNTLLDQGWCFWKSFCSVLFVIFGIRLFYFTIIWLLFCVHLSLLSYLSFFSPRFISISESFVETTPLRSLSTSPWRCWAWTWHFWWTPGCPPGVYMASVWLQHACCTTSSWHHSPGWDWRPLTCILHSWKSLTFMCPPISSSSVLWDGVSHALDRPTFRPNSVTLTHLSM